jgi:hypothetical protein
MQDFEIHTQLIPVGYVSTVFFISFSYSDSFYLLVVGTGGYCCTWSHSMTHTHTR